MESLKITAGVILKLATMLERMAVDPAGPPRAAVRGVYNSFKLKLQDHFNDKLAKLNEDQYNAISNAKNEITANVEAKKVGTKYNVAITITVASPAALGVNEHLRGGHGILTAYLNHKESINMSRAATAAANAFVTADTPDFSIINDLLFTMP
ncbi:MAG: hypothetical protein Q8P20_09505 [bacterium]|nr:hypothetical protein [bacterium]